MDMQLISAEEYEHPLNASDRGLLCNSKGKTISGGRPIGRLLIYPKEKKQTKKVRNYIFMKYFG